MPGNGAIAMAKQGITTYLKEAIESGFDFIKRSFESIEEMNENFHAQRDFIFKSVERKADYKRRLAHVLEVIKLHSCKYLGISYMTENRLCEEYGALFGETISKRTVSSIIKHLRELSLISTIATKRRDGKQSANIIVMERLGKAGESEGPDRTVPSSCADASEASGKVAHKEPENLQPNKTKSSLKTTAKDSKERYTSSGRLLNFVPRWFKETIACCATEGKSVLEYWRVTKHLTQRVYGERLMRERVGQVVQTTVLEFYQAAKAATKGKFCMHNPYGYYFRMLEAGVTTQIRRDARSQGAPFYNWLTNCED